MAAAGHGEGLGKIRRDEIGNQEEDGAAADHAVEVVQSAREVRPPAFGLEIEHLADQAQGVQAAFFWRDVKLDIIAEKQEPDLVVVVDRAEGQDRGHLGGQLALAQLHAPECPRRAHIHHQHDRELPLLRELFHIRRIHPGGHVPVDRTDLIARGIFPNLLEIHPAAFENTVVLAGEPGIHQAAGPQLEPADLFQDFFGVTVHFLEKFERRNGEFEMRGKRRMVFDFAFLISNFAL